MFYHVEYHNILDEVDYKLIISLSNHWINDDIRQWDYNDQHINCVNIRNISLTEIIWWVNKFVHFCVKFAGSINLSSNRIGTDE